MSLKWGVRQAGDVVILDLRGRITLGEAVGAFRDEIRGLLANKQKNILLNLAKVSHVDSCGLGELVGLFTTVTTRDGQLKLLNLRNRIRALLQITKLDTVFETFTDEKAALRSFQTPAQK